MSICLQDFQFIIRYDLHMRCNPNSSFFASYRIHEFPFKFLYYSFQMRLGIENLNMQMDTFCKKNNEYSLNSCFSSASPTYLTVHLTIFNEWYECGKIDTKFQFSLYPIYFMHTSWHEVRAVYEMSLYARLTESDFSQMKTTWVQMQKLC